MAFLNDEKNSFAKWLTAGGLVYIDKTNYHPPRVKWNEEWKGKTWRDMPPIYGCQVKKKSAFALWRRGMLVIDEDV